MYYGRKVNQRKQLAYLKQHNINDGFFFAKSELKRTRTPTWITLLLDYAIKVVHFGEWVWIATSSFAEITKSGFTVRGREKIAYSCMPFLSYSLFYLSKFYVILSLFSLFFLFRPLYSLPQLFSPFHLWLLFLFILDQSQVISLFCPRCSPTIFVYSEYPLRSANYLIGHLASTTPGHAQNFLSLLLPIPRQILTHLVLL